MADINDPTGGAPVTDLGTLGQGPWLSPKTRQKLLDMAKLGLVSPGLSALAVTGEGMKQAGDYLSTPGAQAVIAGTPIGSAARLFGYTPSEPQTPGAPASLTPPSAPEGTKATPPQAAGAGLGLKLRAPGGGIGDVEGRLRTRLGALETERADVDSALGSSIANEQKQIAGTMRLRDVLEGQRASAEREAAATLAGQSKAVADVEARKQEKIAAWQEQNARIQFKAKYWRANEALGGEAFKQMDALDQTINDETVRPETRAQAQAQRQALQDKMQEYSELDESGGLGPDTARGVVAAIAVGLGTFAAILSKTPNYALQIVDGLIQRDIERQKLQMSSGKERLAEHQNELARIMEDTRDEITAVHMKGALDYQRAALLVQSKANLVSDMDQRMKMQELQGGLEQKALSEMQNANARQETLAMQQANLEVEAGYKRGMLGLQGLELQLKASGGTAGKTIPAGEINKQSEMKATAEALEDMKRRFTADNRPVLDYAVRALSAITPGWASEPSQWENRVESMAPLLKSLYNSGVFSDKDYERGKAMLPHRGEPTEKGVNKLDTLIDFIRGKIKTNIAALEGAGYNVPEELKTFGAQGSVSDEEAKLEGK